MKRKHWFWSIFLCAVVIAGFFALCYLGWDKNAQRIQHLMLLAIIATVPFIFMNFSASSTEKWTWLIIIAGLIMRIGYALYTPTTVRMHDMGEISLGSNGHAGYILQVFINHALPVSNEVQFTQPPLYYFVSAGFMSLYDLLTGIKDYVQLFEVVRLTSCLASCLTLLLSYKIGKELKLEGIPFICFLCLCSFFPNHYLLAGRVNPDSVSVLFIYGIVLFSIRWYHTQSLKNTIILALCFGFGMMTKFTVAVLAIPTGTLMLYVVYKQIVKHRTFRILWMVLLFLAICAPLGLWYPIRGMILFSQPLGSLYELPISSNLYIGNISISSRFGLFSPIAILSPLYVSTSETNNLWLYLVKSSVFGEFTYRIDRLIPTIIMACISVLTITALIGYAIGGWKTLRSRNQVWMFLGLTLISVIISFVLFNLRYPFRCSMDFRYIVVSSLLAALSISKVIELLRNNGFAGKGTLHVLMLVVVLFSICSIIMFTAI